MLIAMDEGGPEAPRLLELFEDNAFITTDNDSYGAIENVARDFGLIEQ